MKNRNKMLMAATVLCLIGVGIVIAHCRLNPIKEHRQDEVGADEQARVLSVLDGAGNNFAAEEDRLMLIDGATGDILKKFPELGSNVLISSISSSSDGLFAAERNSGLVYRFSIEGRLLSIIGGNSPVGVFVPGPYFSVSSVGDGIVWLSNPGHHRVERYDLNGGYLGAIDIAAQDGPTGCCNPISILALDDGSVLVGEKGIYRVRQYDSEGRLIRNIAGEKGTPLDHLPDELTVTDGFLCVSDGSETLRIKREESQ